MVEIVRYGTATPIVLPQRITDELITMLKKYKPVWINVHYNHPKELTEHSRQALDKLADAGFVLGNQSVPEFIVDLPGGGGKTPVHPRYMLNRNDRTVIFRNYEGVIAKYVEPEDTRSLGCPENCTIYEDRRKRGLDEPKEGLERLFGTDEISLEPAHLARRERRK